MEGCFTCDFGIVSFFALALASCASAQVTARLTGSVLDPSGAVVPSAVVEVYLPGGSKPLLSTPATSDGLFTFSGVNANTYDVSASAPGFRKSTVHGVVLTAGEETALSIKLEVGNTTETVEVTESSVVVQTTNAEVSNNMSRAQIKDLPMLNRSPLSLVTALAGVSNGRAGDSVINGQRTSFTNMTLDGINIQDNFIRTNAVDFSPNLLLLDQVAEMTISTSNTNPAFGNGASQVTFVTPSGTNKLHGGLFEQNRNSHFAANTWFNNQSGVKRPFLNLEPARRQNRRPHQKGPPVLLREFRGLPVSTSSRPPRVPCSLRTPPMASSRIPMPRACCKRSIFTR